MNCNDKLFKWNLNENNTCNYCEEIDTIEHHFFDCNESRKTWKSLQNWIKNNLDISFPLTICEVLFGIPIFNDPNIQIINFLIIITKWYINQCRTKGKNIFFIEMISIVKNKIDGMAHLNKMRYSEDDSWINKLNCLL